MLGYLLQKVTSERENSSIRLNPELRVQKWRPVSASAGVDQDSGSLLWFLRGTARK